MEYTKPLVTEKNEFWYRVETLYLSLVGESEVQYSNARKEIDSITIENIFTTGKLFREILI